MRLLLRNGFVFSNGVFRLQDVAIENGIITQIRPDINIDSYILQDCHSQYVIPGLADVHVHLREPGFSYKETIKSGTAAAARGGFTALCSMPNVSPPPDCAEYLEEQLAIIERDALIPVTPYGCITVGGTGRGELVDYAKLRDKVAAFSDDGKGVQECALMEAAMLNAKPSLIAAHCEDEALLCGGCIHDGEYAKAHGHVGISSESEWRQIERDLELVRKTGCAYHVCHVSAKESVALIRAAKREGLDVTCETAPHYIAFCDGDLQEDGRFKMNPPLRSSKDRAALIEGIRDGTIDMIATDHAPHSAEEKSRGLKDSAFGVVGLETALSAIYTKLVRTGDITMEQLVKLMSITPRWRFGLGRSEIEVGQKADLCVFDPAPKVIVNPEEFLSHGRATPFAGTELHGEVKLTMAGGKIVWG